MKRHILVFLLLLLFCASTDVSAYVFGMKSANNSIDNIERIQNDYNLDLSMVAYIFDHWHWWEKETMLGFSDSLGTDKIYHITFSPSNYSAHQVRDGIYDLQYKEFFTIIKNFDLKVIFRTMHEANGGRYPWAGDPEAYKDAWMHVYELSRQVGLDQTNILFDFSSNHWDMPSVSPEGPSQQSELLECTPQVKQEQGCLSFEDYYPGDEYVDIVGFTFYNRGKGNSDRKWLSPYEILYDEEWKTVERLQALGKPLIIDEMASSAIWYPQMYNWERSKSLYPLQFDKKNQWLKELAGYLQQETNVLGAVYFNVDYTRGLQEQIIGEADWAAINVSNNQVYTGIYYVDQHSSKDSFDTLASLFGSRVLWRGDQHFLYPKEDHKLLMTLRNIFERHMTNRLTLRRTVAAVIDRLELVEDTTDMQDKLLSLLKILHKYY